LGGAISTGLVGIDNLVRICQDKLEASFFADRLKKSVNQLLQCPGVSLVCQLSKTTGDYASEFVGDILGGMHAVSPSLKKCPTRRSCGRFLNGVKGVVTLPVEYIASMAGHVYDSVCYSVRVSSSICNVVNSGLTGCLSRLWARREGLEEKQMSGQPKNGGNSDAAMQIKKDL
jgi:hypothetical protein